jgi:hypothetical protein
VDGAGQAPRAERRVLSSIVRGTRVATSAAVELLRVTALCFFFGFAATATALACSGTLGPPAGVTPPSADVIDPVVGAPDRGADPAVVAIESEGAVLCAGALVAPDAVLTARRCVGPPCDGQSPPAPASLVVRFGDGVGRGTGPVSRVRDVVGAELGNACSAGVALLQLDTPVDGVQPLALRSTGAAQGDRVRTVAFDLSPEKIVRDHVLVTTTTTMALVLRESPGPAGSGRVVVDEAAQLVGIVTGPAGPSATNAAIDGDLAARVDRFAPFLAPLLGPDPSGSNGGSRLRTSKGPVDMSADCAGAVDCASSVCVSTSARRYCSRTCDGVDRCPSRWRCQLSAAAWRVCVEI